jgi:hypothetical protein
MVTFIKYQVDVHYWLGSQSESIKSMLTIGQDHNQKVSSRCSVLVKNRGYQVCNGQKQKRHRIHNCHKQKCQIHNGQNRGYQSESIKWMLTIGQDHNQKVSIGCSLLVKITIRKYQLDAHYWSRSQS